MPRPGPCTARPHLLYGTSTRRPRKAKGTPLWVADGYHRVCASYHLDEKTPVPCRMAARTPKG